MFQSSYAEVISESETNARQEEAEALARSISLMEEATRHQGDKVRTIEAAHYTRQLWTHFLTDLASPENDIETRTKANLISIGIWVLKELQRMRELRLTDFGPVIEVSKSIRGGLDG